MRDADGHQGAPAVADDVVASADGRPEAADCRDEGLPTDAVPEAETALLARFRQELVDERERYREPGFGTMYKRSQGAGHVGGNHDKFNRLVRDPWPKVPDPAVFKGFLIGLGLDASEIGVWEGRRREWVTELQASRAGPAGRASPPSPDHGEPASPAPGALGVARAPADGMIDVGEAAASLAGGPGDTNGPPAPGRPGRPRVLITAAVLAVAATAAAGPHLDYGRHSRTRCHTRRIRAGRLDPVPSQ